MSTSLFRVMAIACAVVLSAGVVSAAVHDDGEAGGQVVADRDRTDADEEVATDDSSSSTTAPPSSGEEQDGEPRDAAPSTAGDGSTTPDTGSGPPSESSSTTTRPPTTSSAPTADAPLGTTPTTPGTYTYDLSGTVDGEPVSGTSTLEVAAPDGEGRQRQTQQAPDGATTIVYRFTPQGTYLESMQMASDQGSFTLNATSPFLIIPADAGAGTVREGRLQGGGLSADVTFTLLDVTEAASTARIEADITGKVSGFDVEGTMDNTITARTSDQLPLETDAKTRLSAGGGLVTSRSDIRSELRR